MTWRSVLKLADKCNLRISHVAINSSWLYHILQDVPKILDKLNTRPGTNDCKSWVLATVGARLSEMGLIINMHFANDMCPLALCSTKGV
jgi:hypothetical protein